MKIQSLITWAHINYVPMPTESLLQFKATKQLKKQGTKKSKLNSWGETTASTQLVWQNRSLQKP